MPTKTTFLRLTDRKRAAILQAAVLEFRQSGYEATSMDRIAAQAGVSKRTVYNHFPSKEALFSQILEQLWEASVNGASFAYDRKRPLRTQLLNLVKKKLRLLNDDNFIGLVRVVIAASIHSPERTHNMIARMGEREEGLTTWIRAACEDGRLVTESPLFASTQLQSLIKGCALWPQVTLGFAPLTNTQQQHLAESAVDMFLTYYERKSSSPKF